MDQIYKKSEHIVTREIAGETLLVPIRDKLADMQRIFALHGIGDFVWERIDGKRSVSDIVADIAKSFDVGAEHAEKDLKELIHEMQQADLVTVAEQDNGLCSD